MYEKDGEKYFVVDSPHALLERQPRTTGCRAPSSTPRAGSSASTPTRASGRRRRTGRSRSSRSTRKTTSMKDVFEDGYVDVAIFQPTDLTEWYKEGFNTTERDAILFEKYPGKFILNTRWDPRDGEDGLKDACGTTSSGGAARASSSTPPSGGRAPAGWKLKRPGGVPIPGGVPGAGHQEHPRPQGPDDLAAGQGRVRRDRRRPRGDRLPGAELHRRARRAAAHRGLLLHGDAGAQRVRGSVGGHRRADARPAAVLRQGAWASCCSGSARTR